MHITLNELRQKRRQSFGASLSSKESRHAIAKAMWRIRKAYRVRDAAENELWAAMEQLKEARKVI